jgi:two-component system aerobic respiration control sensor histidine kinase ArcB
MGSELELESKPGKGTTFSFTLSLPMVAPSWNHKADKQPNDILEGSLKLLYVEDLMPNQMVMKAMCKPLEVDLTVVSSGEEALSVCETQDFDLILLDIQMPYMDGYKTFEGLKKLDRFKQSAPKVLAFTAHAGQEQYDNFLSFGFDGALTKPLTPQQLQAFLAEYSSHEHRDVN